MTIESGALTASDGVELWWRTWAPESRPLAVLVLLHGVGEHIERYEGLAGRLSAEGILCYGLDHRGHGRSRGFRVHVDAWERYERDVEEFVSRVVRAETDLPLFVYGHSMGSMIALTLAIHGFGARTDSFAGWIVSGVSLRPTGIAKPWLVATAKVLSKVAPRFTIDLGIAATSLSHEPDVVAGYEEDPLVGHKATVRWGAEALESVEYIKRRASEITDPVLIVHGEDDPLAEAGGARWLAEHVTGEAELIVYEGSLHEPHNEPEYADVAADISSWIRDRLETTK